MTNTEFIKSQPTQEVINDIVFIHAATGGKFTCATVTNDNRIRLYSVADDTGKSDVYVSEDAFNKDFERV